MEWNKLNSLINDCLYIEYNIDNINKINENVKKNNSSEFSIKFYPEEDGINQFLEKIKNFGFVENNIHYNKFCSIINFDQNLVNNWLNNRNYHSELLFRKVEMVQLLMTFIINVITKE